MHANMVGVNQDNFFPSTKLPSIPCPVLSVFIAWLNVDLGIKTYFTDGLNPWLLGKHAFGCSLCFLPTFGSSLHSWLLLPNVYFPIVANSVQGLGMVLLLSYTQMLCPLHHISTLT